MNIWIGVLMMVEVELAGMRASHLRDGAAVAEFFSQLEDDLQKPEM